MNHLVGMTVDIMDIAPAYERDATQSWFDGKMGKRLCR